LATFVIWISFIDSLKIVKEMKMLQKLKFTACCKVKPEYSILIGSGNSSMPHPADLF
jgi:hypothetical protein